METEKQISWFKTDVKFENSFKFWFALNWDNKGIPSFIVFFTLLMLQLFYFQTIWNWLLEAYDEGLFTGIFVTPFMFLPLVGTIIIIYKDFYQHFNDRKNGIRR